MSEKEQRAAALDASVSNAAAAVTRLDTEYAKLNSEERSMMHILERLRKEEVALQKALQEASDSKRYRKERDDAAVARLERALFQSDSSDDEPNETNDLSS